VGRKIAPLVIILEDTCYTCGDFGAILALWPMRIQNISRFQCKGFSYLMLRGKEYWLGDLVVVEPYEHYKGHTWTWKAKIATFFIHEFYGDKRVFFQGEFYNIAMSISSSSLAFTHSSTLGWLFYNHVCKSGLEMTSDLHTSYYIGLSQCLL
jgi:hypothetical protein